MSTDWLQVYRASMYALPNRRLAGLETRFALDADPGEAARGAELLEVENSATLITAWNPNSIEQEAAWNQDANRRLAEALAAAEVDFLPSYGASLPDTSPAWREDGFVLFGLDRASARQWGRDWQQRALVHIDGAAAGLLFCANEVFYPCGVRLLAGTDSLGPQDG